MKPFQRGYLDENQVRENIEAQCRQWSEGCEEIRKAFPAADINAARAAITSMFQDIHENEYIWINDVYQVNERRVQMEIGQMIHLSIKRRDKQTIHDWRDLQEIKNLLVGPEHEAVELYPAESRRVDTANQYHLWVAPDPTYRMPFGFIGGRFVTDKPIGKSVNRKLK